MSGLDAVAETALKRLKRGSDASTEEISILAMSLSEALRPVAFLVAFLLVGFYGNRRTWITTETMVSFGFGIGYILAPGFMMDFMVIGRLGDVHYFIGRLFGITLLSSSIVWYITRESRDGTVPITLIMSRVFGVSLTLLVQAHTYFIAVPCSSSKSKAPVVWNSQFLVYGMWGTGLWLLGNFMHLIKSNDFNTYPQHNIRLHTHLRIDAWLLMVVAVGALAFPEYIITLMFQLKAVKLNCAHVHVVRCIGAMNLGEAVVSLQAPGFLHERDKRAIFFSRISSQLLLLLPWVYAGIWSGLVTLHELRFAVLVPIPIIANAMIAYFSDCTTIYRVPTSPNNDEKKTQ